MELIFEWVEADRGCIMLMDPVTKTLKPKVRHTRKALRVDERITISKTILDYVIERNEGVLTSDARQDDRWDPGGSIMQMGVREAICVPMQGATTWSAQSTSTLPPRPNSCSRKA